MLDFSFEKKYWSQNKKLVIGIDEVGRGPLAGPVVVGAVIISPENKILSEVKDSKKIPKKKHAQIAELIKQNCEVWAVGVGTVAQINELGIVGAIKAAIYQALEKIGEHDQILMDGLPFAEPLKITSEIDFITKGDAKVYSIAAASIIAKNYRDELMKNLAKKPQFAHYGWEKNSGYGTRQHRESIKKHGVTAHHRELFVRKLV